MNLNIVNHPYRYEMEKLTRMFFPGTDFIISFEKAETGEYFTIELSENVIALALFFQGREKRENFTLKNSLPGDCEAEMAKYVFEFLSSFLSYRPPWGILTGIRPGKLMCSLIEERGEEYAVEYFRKEFLCSEEKTDLCFKTALNELPALASVSPDSFSLYISVPFCPTRCSYCSFVSHANEQAKKLIPEYTDKLCEEIEYTARITEKLGLKLDCVYFGGGTPTTLSASQLLRIHKCLRDNFDFSRLREYTVEAGRPDSVDDEKFAALKKMGVGRISINPQSFNDTVLKAIGRRHTSQQTLSAYEAARKYGFSCINTDIIAGLPGDSEESFNATVEKCISLSPENITVHSLSLKKSSFITTENREVPEAVTVRSMLESAGKKLTAAGYEPYYLYRQSKCIGNFENVGWAKKEKECLYNIFMMEEHQSVIALGAGAVTKLKNPYTPDVERIANYKYPYEYTDRFETILKRKDKIITFYEKIKEG